MAEYTITSRWLLQTSLMVLILATYGLKDVHAHSPLQPLGHLKVRKLRATGPQSEGESDVNQKVIPPPTMESSNENRILSPAIQQLCGLMRVPPEPANLVGVLGPVQYQNITTGRLAYLR